MTAPTLRPLAARPDVSGFLRVASALLLVALPGCAEDELGDEDLEPRLANGIPTGEPDMMPVGTFGGCTGTLIGPRTVLTAAHCVGALAQGCGSLPPVGLNFTFADQMGNPLGDAAQSIPVIGFAAHPDFYGNRVSSCPNPQPMPTSCPEPADDPGFYDLPSCGLVQACTGSTSQIKKTITFGAHLEHDIALAYLAYEPVGITPARVIVGSSWNNPSKNLYGVANIETWLDTNGPTVTIAGYGFGSTTWPDPNNPGSSQAGRDFGTTEITGVEATFSRPNDCNGNNPPNIVAPDLRYGASEENHSFTGPGDSGGPVFAGAGYVASGMPSPTALDPSTGLSGRLVVGVHSRGSTTSMNGAASPTYAPDNSAFLFDRIDDLDGDGVINAYDNCVAVANVDQANCNADAELDRNGDVLGDACDPVPCPEVDPVVTQEVPIWSLNGGCFGHYRWRQVQSTLQPKPRGSKHPLSGFGVTSNEATYFRFCQPDAAAGVDCGAQWRKSAHLVTSADPPPLGDNPWLPMTFWYESSPFQPVYTYPSMPFGETWDYWADREAWLEQGWIADPGGTPKPSTTPESNHLESSGLDGVIGSRAGSTSNVLGTQLSPMNGVHASDSPQGTGMSAHFEAYAPDPTVDAFWFDCVDCQLPCKEWPWDIFRYCPVCGVRPETWMEHVNPADLVMTKTPEGDWGYVHPELGIVAVEGLVDESLAAHLENAELQMLSSVEPFAAIGSIDPGYQAMFVSLDGTRIEGAMMAFDGGFRLDEGIHLEIDAAPRFGHVGVFSRAAGGAFIIGGSESPRGGEPIGEILFFPFEGESGTQLELEFAPQDVLAATYDHVNGRLLVLDQIAERRVAQLTAIDPISGAVDTIWSGEVSGDYTAHWLVMDRNGELLLFASNEAQHCIATIGETADESMVSVAEHPLFSAPMADAGGVQLTLSVEGHLQTERYEAIELEEWGSMGACL